MQIYNLIVRVNDYLESRAVNALGDQNFSFNFSHDTESSIKFDFPKKYDVEAVRTLLTEIFSREQHKGVFCITCALLL